MGILTDLKVLRHLILKPVRGKSHQERLESFYRGQAGAYDDFRRRLLQGREELYQALSKSEGCIWLDMGGGTGANLEFISNRLNQVKKVYIVDLSSSLLEIARRRIIQQDWKNVEAVEADATSYVPPEGQADIITFSYSLTMIPDWFAAIEHAHRILKPGGRIGVVDFYVSRKHPSPSHIRHGWFGRTFWPPWFAGDNVFLSGDHVPFLHRRFRPVLFEERLAKVPYMLGAKVPYYRFIGEKTEGQTQKIVVAALIEDQGQYLIAQRKLTDRFPGLWEFPGGKVEPGESPESALQRECREELDIEINVQDIHEVIHHRYESFTVLLLFYRCSLLSGTPKPLGCERCEWVPRGQLTNYDFLPADKPLIERL